jgi:prophage regulatory protein
MPKKILEYSELREHGVNYSRRQVDRKEADPNSGFPKRVPMGPNRVGWVAEEIAAYVDRMIASRSSIPGTLGSAVGNPRKRGRQAERPNTF